MTDIMSKGVQPEDVIEDCVDLSTSEPKVYKWAYTLAVAPYRRCKLLDMNKRYQDYMLAEQKHILASAVIEACKFLDLDPFDMVYESTQKGNAHIHGKFFSDSLNCKLFQTNLCIMLGYPNNAKQSTCFIKQCFTNPQVDPIYRDWYDYQVKDTPIGRYGGLNIEQYNTNLFL